jgi:hypothetical protein
MQSYDVFIHTRAHARTIFRGFKPVFLGLILNVLFKDPVSCYDCIVSVIDELMQMERCWNDTNRGKPLSRSKSYS